MDYRLYEQLLASEDMPEHPNIDTKSIQAWQEQRRQDIKEILLKRKEEIEKKEIRTKEEEKEIEKINQLTKEEIVEIYSKTTISDQNQNQNNDKDKNNLSDQNQKQSCETEEETVFLATDAPPELQAVESDLLGLLSQSDTTIEYLMHALSLKEAVGVSDYLMVLLVHNAKEGLVVATKRICKYVIAYDYIQKAKLGQITQSLIYAIEKEGHAYWAKVFQHYHPDA
ncbi:hypothetical protein NEHOM01_0905 [Nematocida homosporus]|uniref:uncharacterized protein n=1 Tax=Nematocida homosporus TaxID=1912981 RepID=UPI0022203750|nr:uncharacterized protein NEHOM01_0905 [Nematocida homosporus]KAI5185546.1 hypothetical protein NEHOM01_0905 [Nematocida homosporus]